MRRIPDTYGYQQVLTPKDRWYGVGLKSGSGCAWSCIRETELISAGSKQHVGKLSLADVQVSSGR